MALVGGENEKIKNWVRAGGRQPGDASAKRRAPRGQSLGSNAEERLAHFQTVRLPENVRRNAPGPRGGKSRFWTFSSQGWEQGADAEQGPCGARDLRQPARPEGLCSCIFVVVRIGLRLFKCSISSVSILVIHIFKAFRVFYVVEIIYLNCS